jgi:hypothetical protein
MSGHESLKVEVDVKFQTYLIYIEISYQLLALAVLPQEMNPRYLLHKVPKPISKQWWQRENTLPLLRKKRSACHFSDVVYPSDLQNSEQRLVDINHLSIVV